MIDFSISNIGHYSRPERFEQVVHCPWLSLTISGLKFSRLYCPDGELIDAQKGDKAFFRLSIPGISNSFEYGKDRDNWVIMFNKLPIRFSESSKKVLELQDGGDWIQFPICKQVPLEALPHWQTEMRKMRELWLSPLPRNRFRAELIILNIFKYFLSNTLGSMKETPAGKLKRLIDEDNEFAKTISGHSQECFYSQDHLRIQFQKEYQISPQDYRTQKRLACIMDYISTSTLTVNEIAIETGFEHTSHLCKIFKQHFGKTPGEAIKQFRYR